MVTSPYHLARVLDCIFRPSSEKTSSCIYRSFAWLAFFGMLDIESVTVVKQQLDFKNMRVMFGGHTYPIYPESLDDLRTAANIMSFRVIWSGANGAEVSRNEDRVGGHRILRSADRSGESAEDSSGELDIPRAVKQLRNGYSKFLSDARRRNEESMYPMECGFGQLYDEIFRSGVFYRLFIRELAGQTPDFPKLADELIGQHISASPDSHMSEGTYKTAKSRIKVAYEREYGVWKGTFGI